MTNWGLFLLNPSIFNNKNHKNLWWGGSNINRQRQITRRRSRTSWPTKHCTSYCLPLSFGCLPRCMVKQRTMLFRPEHNRVTSDFGQLITAAADSWTIKLSLNYREIDCAASRHFKTNRHNAQLCPFVVDVANWDDCRSTYRQLQY